MFISRWKRGVRERKATNNDRNKGLCKKSTISVSYTHLYEYGLANYEKSNIYEKVELAPVPVTGGIQAEMPLQVQEQEISLLLCDQDEVRMEAEIPETMEAPVQLSLIHI